MGDTLQIDRSSNNTHLAVQKWSKKLFKYSWAEDAFRRYIGKGPNFIIELKNDLLAAHGDKIQFDIFALLSGNGESDDGTYEGNEAALTSYYMDILLHERGNSVKINGKMTEKRTIHNLRAICKSMLGVWLARKRSLDVVTALSGLICVTFAGQVTGALDKDSSSVQIKTVSNGVAVAPAKGATALRWFGGGQTTAGVIERVAADANVDSATLNLFGTAVISYVKRMAKRTITAAGVAISPLRPIRVDGEEHFIMFIDEFQAKQLVTEDAWQKAQREAGIRGKKNAIFTGALGMWDGVIIKSCQLVHRRLGAGTTGLDEGFEHNGTATTDACASGITVARALFCGAQAACLAQGQYPTFVEKFHDYKTKFGVHTDTIYGVEKTRFNSIDFGCIIVDTAVVAD